jgi:hypothetical protein
MVFPKPTVAQAIEVIVRYRAPIDLVQLAMAIFGSGDRASDLRKDLAWLVKEGHLRVDAGKYFPGRIGPTNLNSNDHYVPE